MPKRPLESPIQTNIIKDYQFKFEIEIFPHVSYHMRNMQLPGVSVDNPQFSTPHRDLMLPGTKLTFDVLTVAFLLDDDLSNYKEVYYWLLYMAMTTSPYDERPYSEKQSDAVLHILDGDLTPKTSVKFINCHPTTISDLSFDSGMDVGNSMEAFITLEYDYFIFDGDPIL